MKRMRSCRTRNASIMPFIPSPGMPNTVSTPQSMIDSIRTSAAVSAIFPPCSSELSLRKLFTFMRFDVLEPRLHHCMHPRKHRSKHKPEQDLRSKPAHRSFADKKRPGRGELPNCKRRQDPHQKSITHAKQPAAMFVVCSSLKNSRIHQARQHHSDRCN